MLFISKIKKIYTTIFAFIFISALSLAVTGIVSAQEMDSVSDIVNQLATGNSANTSINLSPANPEPGQMVTATIQSYSFEADKADISWVVNGSLVKRGFGQKTVSFNGPKIGEIMVVRMEAKTPEGLIYSSQRTIQNRSISLVVEPLDSYVPFWYEGKALPSRAGKVRIYALTSFYSGNTVLSPGELVYTWTIAGEKLDSGVGKNYIDYQTIEMQGNSIDVSVKVSPLNSNENILSTTKIKPTDSQLLIYEKDPLVGIKSQKALTGSVEGKDIFTLVAEPFFFSTDRSKLENMTYSWTINGAQASGAQTFERVFKLNSNQKGTVSVGVNVQRVKKLLQRASVSLNIIFN